MPFTPDTAPAGQPTSMTIGLAHAAAAEPARSVVLRDGQKVNIAGRDRGELLELHWEQERLFAADILASERGSEERKRITAQAYTTVCAIFEELSQQQSVGDGSVFSMGMDIRYRDLVLRLLSGLPKNLAEKPFFELGFSAGGLLKEVADAGYAVAGLEVVDDLRIKATECLPTEYHANLYVGEFLTADLRPLVGQCGIVYWNDVFEHIHPDEIEAYVRKLYALLAPAGKLITITPNWHMRPSDVTNEFQPPRSQAVGFHLKEYTLGEVVSVLKQAGFAKVTTPSFISPRKIHLAARCELTAVKTIVEPLLEWLPYSIAVQVCRRFGFNLTIAHKQN